MKIHPQVLLRVPQLPLDLTLKQAWELLKASIQLSSNDFYQQIKNLSADELEQLPRAVYHTIWKYYNRAKYRATPYGSFAGCGVLEMSPTAHESQSIVIDQEQILHKFPCWSLSVVPAEKEIEVNPDTLLFANTSYYLVGEQLRYLVREDHTFLLAETTCQPHYLKILSTCLQPKTAAEIQSLAECTIADLQDMVDLQLLLTENLPNIVGEDYFQRTGYKAQQDEPEYLLAERKILQSNFSGEIFKELPELIHLTASLIPTAASDDLEAFKNAFRKKFEYKTVPLMEALDPEVGLRYANLDSAGNISPALEQPAPTERPSDTKVMIDLLFISLIDSGCKVINLENIAKHAELAKHTLPGTFAVLYSVIDEHLVVEQITGGANRILGRFSMISEEFSNLSRALAAEEAKTNPEVLFFDIGHTEELMVDNVNRRKIIYPDQLPILNYSGTDAALYLHDLDLTLAGNELILFDRRRNKRVVPRLSSGYNYKRSNLAVYRFLCDLQYDGIKTNFSFKLPDYFPGKNYYPRVQYKQIILSPAQWRVTRKAYLESCGGKKDIQTLKTYLNRLGLKQYATTRTEDRTMCFDLEDSKELRELLHIMEKFESFTLEEGLFLPKTPLVKNLTNQGYANQFVLSILNDQKTLNGFDRSNVIPSMPVSARQAYLPAEQWLYFEIYSHPLRADYLLKTHIETLVTEHASKIQYWFFIRYDENGPHLRIRIKLNPEANQTEIISELHKSLQPELSGGIISDLKICTYKPETERYGKDLIQQVEQHFCKDSQYILQIIEEQLDTDTKHTLALNLLIEMQNATTDQQPQAETYINQVNQIFSQDYQLSGPSYKDLNQRFKKLTQTQPQLSQTLTQYFNTCKTSATQLIQTCPPERKVKLMADLIHMHLNRLFTAHQRSHEFLVYYCAQKLIFKQRALNKESTYMQGRL